MPPGRGKTREFQTDDDDWILGLPKFIATCFTATHYCGNHGEHNLCTVMFTARADLNVETQNIVHAAAWFPSPQPATPPPHPVPIQQSLFIIPHIDSPPLSLGIYYGDTL